MKYISLFFFTCIILFGAVAQKSKTSAVYVYKYVDIFNQHIHFLDSAITLRRNFTHSCDSSIIYMERVTHIKAQGEGNCWGSTPTFTWHDLSLWKTWYKNIGSKRIGVIN